MNVNELNMNTSSFYKNKLQRTKNTSDVDVQVKDSNSVYAPMQHEDFASTIWNMTDSMPRENQISFTADVLATKMLNQGVTDDNKAFLRNISNRFNTDEIGLIKSSIMNNPKVQNSDSATVQEFLNSLDEIMSDKANEALQSQLKQKNLHKFRSMDEIFFQTTLHFDTTRKGLFSMGDQEAINYDKA